MMRTMRGWRRIGWAALALAALAATPKGSKLPDTKEGKRMSAFLAAIDSGKEAAIAEFVEKNFSTKDLERVPAGPRVRRFAGFANEASPLVLEKILASGREGPAALFRSKKTGTWYEIRLELTPDAGREILGVDIEESDADAAKPEPVFRSYGEIASLADAYLSKLARTDRFSGVALLARKGKPLLEKAYGLADRARKIGNTLSTKFNIGSINKIFTQVAVAELASQGRLSLSDTVRKHLPDYPSPAADDITILELVNMSSGLGDIFGERFEEAAPRLFTLNDFAKLFADEPLLFPPGKGRRYSNAGYIALGLIIEKVSGQSYHDYVRDHVFTPAGMRSSGPSERGVASPDVAVGYTKGGADTAGANLQPNTGTLPARSSSAGGGLSTAKDLLAFDLALREGKLLPAPWTAWIYSDKTAPASEGDRIAKNASLGIAGGSPGVNAALLDAVGDEFTIVVLANLDPPSAERSAVKFRRWIEKTAGALAP